MSDTSPVLAMPLIQPAQAQKHVTHNEALRILDAIVQLTVTSAALGEPPAAPELGARYIVAAPASGAWAGQEGRIAVHEDGTWTFHAAQPGWRADDRDTAAQLRFDGTAWQPVVPELQNLDGVGIGAASDGTNRLVVSAEASLFSHAGAGHQLKLNKSTATETASLLFQTGWSGRAEMGTTGDDDFAIKVSADGQSWTAALSVEGESGRVRTGGDLAVAGTLQLAALNRATLPDAAAAGAGAMVFVPDAAGGAQPAYSDGIAWRRVTDGQPV